MTKLGRDGAICPIVFIDDASTFGGAQVALAWAIRVVLRNSDERIICVCTPGTRRAVEEIAGETPRLEFVECPGSLPFNIVSFPLRLAPFLRIFRSLRRKGVRAWWLSLPDIEYGVAPLCALRLLGESPRAWLHNAERAAFFTRHSSWARRLLSRMRDGLAEAWLFPLYRDIITPSLSTLSELQARLGPSKRRPVGHLYCPTIRAEAGKALTLGNSDDSTGQSGISLWMIGRVEYGHKNSVAALEVMKLLREQGKEARLTVIGDGADFEDFARRTESLGLNGSVEMKGWMSDPWPSVPKDAVVLIPSNYETMCLVAREAMIRGIRLVCSPIPVFREWIPSRLIAEDFSAEAFVEKVLDVRRLSKDDLVGLYAAALARFSDTLFVESFIAITDGKMAGAGISEIAL